MPELYYPRLAEAFYASPWAILPAKLLEIRAWLTAKVRGEAPPAWAPPAAGPLERAGGARVGKAAVVPVYGTISQRASLLSDASGGTSCEAVGRALDSLAADATCKAVVLDVDSPGGSVFGVGELAAKVRALAAEKKVVAVANSMAASAAYWIAAAAAEVYCTPGGQVGSIGVLSAHEDLSAAEALQGVKTTLVSAGTYKAEGNPYGPLDDEARAQMQKTVDDYYASFVAAVAKGRGVSVARVRSDYGQGRLLSARDAKAAGMIDGVATLEQVLARLGGGAAPAGAAAEAWRPSVDLLRRRLDVAAAG